MADGTCNPANWKDVSSDIGCELAHCHRRNGIVVYKPNDTMQCYIAMKDGIELFSSSNWAMLKQCVDTLSRKQVGLFVESKIRKA